MDPTPVIIARDASAPFGTIMVPDIIPTPRDIHNVGRTAPIRPAKKVPIINNAMVYFDMTIFFHYESMRETPRVWRKFRPRSPLMKR